MKGRPIRYSAEELAWLEANHKLPIRDYHAGFVAAFARSDVAPPHLHALRKRKGWKTGRDGRFRPGDAASNKGKRCAPGEGGNHPRARANWFRPGVLQGVAARRHKPIGTERIVGGYLERKVHDGLPMRARWQPVHRLNWEALNGPVPDGHALKCLDGNRLNVDPANWIAVPRALLPRLAGGNRRKPKLAYDEAPPELRPLILAIARLEHAAREKRRRSRS